MSIVSKSDLHNTISIQQVELSIHCATNCSLIAFSSGCCIKTVFTYCCLQKLIF
uniref:Uncharacterized protein n=1 Tax=Anguilla anguilla TaxID=7936 RepID=A0A0E9XLB2_ANGAN